VPHITCPRLYHTSAALASSASCKARSKQLRQTSYLQHAAGTAKLEEPKATHLTCACATVLARLDSAHCRAKYAPSLKGSHDSLRGVEGAQAQVGPHFRAHNSHVQQPSVVAAQKQQTQERQQLRLRAAGRCANGTSTKAAASTQTQ
jgi:hypothetical protein